VQEIRAAAEAAISNLEAERWRFTHDKLREFVLAKLSAEELRDKPLRLEVSIESAYRQRPEYLPALAHPFEQAEVWNKAAAYLLALADRVLQQGALEQALRNHKQATELQKRFQAPQLMSRLRRALACHKRCVRFGRAGHARYQLWVGHSYWLFENPRRAFEEMGQALLTAQELEMRHDQALAHLWLG